MAASRDTVTLMLIVALIASMMRRPALASLGKDRIWRAGLQLLPLRIWQRAGASANTNAPETSSINSTHSFLDPCPTVLPKTVRKLWPAADYLRK
jgi:hypothetical protein